MTFLLRLMTCVLAVALSPVAASGTSDESPATLKARKDDQFELEKAAETIRSTAVLSADPPAPEFDAAMQLLAESTDHQTANSLALALANHHYGETSEVPDPIRLAGIRLLNLRDKSSTLDYLRAERHSAPESLHKRMDQLIHSVEMGMLRPPKEGSGQKDPEPPKDRVLVATCFGEPIFRDALDSPSTGTPTLTDAELSARRATRLLEMVTYRVTKDYRERNNLQLKDEWIESLKKVAWRHAQQSKDDTTFAGTEEERYLMSWAMQYASMQDWLLTRSLYETYGGRVGMGSLGLWLAPDGRNAVIREAIQAGSLQFHDAALEAAFWTEATKPNFADAYPTGERLEQMMKEPPHLGTY